MTGSKTHAMGAATLAAASAAVIASLVWYAVTRGFVWDEGFHLLAAQLINKGKTPYLDFCFPQTLLNAYWNAAWMRWTGSGWRVTHLWAGILAGGAAAIMAQFVFSRLQDKRWQLATGLMTLGFAGLNQTIWQFATCAQAYATGTFLSVAAFRLTLWARSANILIAVLAGISAGAAAGCTLLTAPVLPVLLIWLFAVLHGNRRWLATFAYLLGAAIPFAPEVALYVRSPKQTLFNVIQYQAIFRRVNWLGPDAKPYDLMAHDFDVFTTWYNDSTTLVIGLLAIGAAVWFRRREASARLLRSEVLLCAAIPLSLVLYISTAHPTFQRYYVFAIPFVAALAAIGVMVVFQQLQWNSRPALATGLVGSFLALGLAKYLIDDRDATTWAQYDQLAAKIKGVTPPGGLIYADEHVYFLLNVTPPTAMEFSYSHKLELPPDQARLYHLVSERELNQQVRSGRFAVVETCKDERIEAMQLPQLFPNQEDVDDCSIFWGKIRPLVPSKPNAHDQ